ncbi:MAG: tail fiber domain-containing protein, partial [Romboutsia timonensis]
KKAIVFFKNSEGNYVLRSRSLSGETYLGTSTYYWKQVASTEFKNTSDRTLKENITYLSNSKVKNASDITIDDMYNFVKNDLPIATYNYIDDNTKKVGFIAQDIIYNEDESDNIIGQLIVNPKSYNEEESHLTYDINNYVSILAGSLQKAINKIEELEARIKDLEAE